MTVEAAQGPFRSTLPVRFSDVDHAGIVYYPTFFHYFHLAFEEFFRVRMGARAYVGLLDSDRIGFPAVRSECDYQNPLRFGDTAAVEMSLGYLGTKSIAIDYRVYRLPGSQAEAEVLVARGQTICAVVDLEQFRAVAVPDKVRALFATLRPADASAR